MRLALLVLVLLSATELFGYRFQSVGSVQSRSFKLLSGNLNTNTGTGWAPTELVLFQGITERDKGKMIYDYSLFYRTPETKEGKVEYLRIARWMVDRETSDILQAIGDNKGEVIGQRLGTISAEENPMGTPFIIETDDTKLTVETEYDPEKKTGIITVSGEKILKDGSVIVWKDELAGD